MDPGAFREDQSGGEQTPPDPNEKTTTSTQDLLLYRDIIETVATAAARENGWLDRADDFQQRLAELRQSDGSPRFNSQGNQRPGASEYVVVLRPVRDGNRVRPIASLQVWNRSAVADGKGLWTLVRELSVDYLSEPSVTPPEGAP